jgi:hypothetical protein
VESILRTARRRATLLAAVVASVGVAAPAAAQAPAGPSATVAAPQPMTLPDLPLIPYGPSPAVQSTAFQPAASLDVPAPPQAGTGWQPIIPRPASTPAGNRPVFLTLTGPKPQPKGALTRFGDSITGLFKRPAPRPSAIAAPGGAAAPAWQWHGYGATSPSGPTAAPASLGPQMFTPPAPPTSALPRPSGLAQVSAAEAQAAVEMPSAPPTAPREPVAYSPPPPVPPTAPPTAHDPWKASAGVLVASATDYPAYRWHGYGAPAAAQQPDVPAPNRVAFAPPPAPRPAAEPEAPVIVTRAVSSAADYATLDTPVPASAAVPAKLSPAVTGEQQWTRSPAAPPAAASPPPSAVRQVAAVQPRPALTIDQLRVRIVQACAGAGRNPEVYPRGPTGLLVRVKVRRALDAEVLANRISALPELAPYQVAFEMQVAP